MKYIKGNDRSQTALIPTSLEEAIDENNEVRIIDLFVDSLDPLMPVLAKPTSLNHIQNLKVHSIR